MLNGSDNLPNYAVLDLSAQINASEHLQVFMRAENMGDKAYQEAQGYNTAGRAVYGGVKYTF